MRPLPPTDRRSACRGASGLPNRGRGVGVRGGAATGGCVRATDARTGALAPPRGGCGRARRAMGAARRGPAVGGGGAGRADALLQHGRSCVPCREARQGLGGGCANPARPGDGALPRGGLAASASAGLGCAVPRRRRRRIARHRRDLTRCRACQRLLLRHLYGGRSEDLPHRRRAARSTPPARGMSEGSLPLWLGSRRSRPLDDAAIASAPPAGRGAGRGDGTCARGMITTTTSRVRPG